MQPTKMSEGDMGLFSKLAKAGLAKKAFDEARKPENQAKIKKAVAQSRAKAQSRGRQRRT